jgi:phosphoribosyl-AMP cyclohydrolase
MGEINNPPILNAKVDHHRRTTQPRVRFGAGVWVGEPPKPRNVARELKNALIVDLVDHPDPISDVPYISREKAEIEASRRARIWSRAERELGMNESVKSRASPGAISDREEGGAFEPKFGADGLATCVTVDASRGDVLMVAHMNEAALRATLATGIVHYWSRSRGALWRKGDTSGQTQTLVEMRVDCDQDAFLVFVTVGGDGGACHTGRRSCFYRKVETDGETARLIFIEAQSANG